MDNNQRAKLDAYNRVTDFNTKHAAVINNVIGDYAAEQQKFDTAVQAINNAGVAQSQQGTDSSVTLTAKETMAKTIVKYCLRAGVKARSLNNTDLSNQLAVTMSDIFRAPKTNAIQVATGKRKALNDNLEILTNITNDNITEIDGVISAYNLIKDAPIETRQTQKSSGTDPLVQLFTDADNAETNLHHLILSYFADADNNSEFVSEFETASQIISTGIRSTSANFTCLADESGNALSSFTVTDQSNNKSYSPDDKGIVTIDHHRTGHFHFTVSSAGRTDVDFATDIKRGTLNTFTIRLKKSA